MSQNRAAAAAASSHACSAVVHCHLERDRRHGTGSGDSLAVRAHFNSSVVQDLEDSGLADPMPFCRLESADVATLVVPDYGSQALRDAPLGRRPVAGCFNGRLPPLSPSSPLWAVSLTPETESRPMSAAHCSMPGLANSLLRRRVCQELGVASSIRIPIMGRGGHEDPMLRVGQHQF